MSTRETQMRAQIALDFSAPARYKVPIGGQTMETRREFIGHLSKTGAVLMLAGTAGSAAMLTGCNVLTDIENWIPVAEYAVNSILDVLSANGVPIAAAITAIVGVIETALNDLLAAVQEYQATVPAPIGALAKIQTILKDISDQFSNFISQLSGIVGTILKVVVSLVSVIISTIAGFVNSLPKTATFTMSFAVAGAPVVAVKRTRRVFKKDFNSQLDAAKTSGVTIPTRAYMKLSLLEHF
jgi:hypothetical protein